ncbi:MAG TPA: orotate phosphoribosyltransferase [Candidatus Binatia bacterium]|nr:orotate phosphoribosyltransferase [Candidatus Binatia bacterium]
MTSREGSLAELIATHSVFYRPRNPFVLSSGKTSPFYFDCRRTTMLPQAMPLIGRLVFERIRGNVDAVGGLTMGADPIACAVAYYSQGRGCPIAAFSVRKEAKSHGMQRWVEGAVAAKSRVAVVEDVVTTGESTLAAIARCREEGFRVERVVALVDREEGGMERIGAEIGPARASAIFRRSEIDAIWRRLRRRTPSSRRA